MISGPSGSTAVTAQRVPAGTYTLSETGTGAAATGYVQVGDWSCQRAGGGAVTVTGGTVTLTDVAATAATANVTCTATNRLATGSLRISKLVDAPAGGLHGRDDEDVLRHVQLRHRFHRPVHDAHHGNPGRRGQHPRRANVHGHRERADRRPGQRLLRLDRADVQRRNR